MALHLAFLSQKLAIKVLNNCRLGGILFKILPCSYKFVYSLFTVNISKLLLINISSAVFKEIS